MKYRDEPDGLVILENNDREKEELAAFLAHFALTDVQAPQMADQLRKDLENKPQPAVAQNPALKPWITPYDTPEQFQRIAPPAPPADAQPTRTKAAQPARTKKPPATTAAKPSASKKSSAAKSTKRSKKPSSGPKQGSTPSSKSGGAKPKASSPTPPRSSTSGRSSSSRSKPTGRSGH